MQDVHVFCPGAPVNAQPLLSLVGSVLDGCAPSPAPDLPVSHLVNAWLAVVIECAGLHVLGYQPLAVQEVQCKALLLGSQVTSSRELGL